MSVEPEPIQVHEERPAEAPPGARPWRWYQIFTALVFIVFCFEVGIFLLIFPWLEYWDRNWFSSFIPEWHRYWENAYVRGAVSGIGVLNIYIALTEVVRLRRFAEPE